MSSTEIKNRQDYISDLVKHPIDNDNFVATFIQKNPEGGKVILANKFTFKRYLLTWQALAVNGKIMFKLDNYFEHEYYDFRAKINNLIF
ncbi:MAG: hypothetical protein NVSMB24_31690 [Mucilaginibacter sp.]